MEARVHLHEPVELAYGSRGRFACRIEAGRNFAFQPAPPPLDDVRSAVRSALLQPLELPPLAQFLVPGDRVVLALDRHTPAQAELLAEVWSVLDGAGVVARDVTVLQPAALDVVALRDPRTMLPDDVSRDMEWVTHDPADPQQQAYLATSTGGERLYLSRRLLDADVTVSIGGYAYDSVLGFRGTNSVFYPGLSNVEAIQRSRGTGHSELGPDDERPLRQLIDEIAWLVGNQFTVQVIASAGSGASAVLAGSADAVSRRARELLDQTWSVRPPERAEVVVCAVDADAAGHGWTQLGAAAAVARSLVARGGKIVLLSELDAELGPGLEMIRDAASARAAVQPIRKLLPPDVVPATQLALAADWAHVYLLSRLPADVVDELFMTPLAHDREVARVLQGDGSCVLVQSAQHAWGETRSAP